MPGVLPGGREAWESRDAEWVYRHSNKRSTVPNNTMTRNHRTQILTPVQWTIREGGACIYGRFRRILFATSMTGRVSVPASDSEMANAVKRHRRSNRYGRPEDGWSIPFCWRRLIRVRPIARVESNSQRLLKRGGNAGFPSWQQGGFLRAAIRNREGAA